MPPTLPDSTAPLSQSVTDLTVLAADLSNSASDLPNSVMELGKSVADLSRLKTELLNSVADLSKSVTELGKSAIELLNSVIDLVNSVADLSKSEAELNVFLMELLNSKAELTDSQKESDEEILALGVLFEGFVKKTAFQPETVSVAGWISGPKTVDAGRFENSPAFQGWVNRAHRKKSRQGRKRFSAVPDGTGVLAVAKPSHKWLGYFQKYDGAQKSAAIISWTETAGGNRVRTGKRIG